MTHQFFDSTPTTSAPDDLARRAACFCDSAPHRRGEYAKRNWGGPLHSLCSYQGKLKPSIAYFLVSGFTEPGQRVLDPLAGVGTIPLEARRQGRVGIASDLSPMADAVCRAKLEPVTASAVWAVLGDLELFLKEHAEDDLSDTDTEFGLNRPIREYFHESTLREIVLARSYFQGGASRVPATARDVVKSSLLHILHGNRPYALSRRSHPVTPFAPSGPTVYRPVAAALRKRLEHLLPWLVQLETQGPAGTAYLSDFRSLRLDEPVDAIITSPPFSRSVRFWSSNWMRLWFAGWSPEDFKSEPRKFLEFEQRRNFDPYLDFAAAAHRLMKPAGTLMLHLGETTAISMSRGIAPFLDDYFHIRYIGTECVRDTESHGLRDKGATVAHSYIFATAR